MSLSAFVGSPDGRKILRAGASGTDAEEVGRRAAATLLAQGAGDLLV